MGIDLKIVRKIVDRKLSFNFKNIASIQVPKHPKNTNITDFLKDQLPAIKYQAAKENFNISTSIGDKFLITNIKGESVTVDQSKNIKFMDELKKLLK